MKTIELIESPSDADAAAEFQDVDNVVKTSEKSEGSKNQARYKLIVGIFVSLLVILIAILFQKYRS